MDIKLILIIAYLCSAFANTTGGVSDPRNGALIKMFNLIDIGERAGSGIPNILSVWNKQGWPAPAICETFNPERITLSLPVIFFSDEQPPINPDDNGEKSAIKAGDNEGKSAITENAINTIINYLTTHTSATCAELAIILDLQVSRTRDYLSSLVSEGKLIAEGGNRNRTYKLKK